MIQRPNMLKLPQSYRKVYKCVTSQLIPLVLSHVHMAQYNLAVTFSWKEELEN